MPMPDIPKPRILIPTPTLRDAAYNRANWPQYAHAVTQAGGEPVVLPLDLAPAALRRELTAAAGVCLPGSPADVDPRRYGATPNPATAPADPAREAVDVALLEHVFAEGKPLLAICFGLQMLNTWRGGSLVQDLAGVPVNHAAGPQVALAHPAVFAEGSRLAGLASGLAPGQTPRVQVNSSHHQAIAWPGEGLIVTARSPEDGVVEAVELPRGAAGPWLLGVQWHPERTVDHDSQAGAFARAIFAKFLEQAASPGMAEDSHATG